LRGNLQPSRDVLFTNISLETAFVPNAPEGSRENFEVLAEWLAYFRYHHAFRDNDSCLSIADFPPSAEQKGEIYRFGNREKEA
jgi:hypothetical protein